VKAGAARQRDALVDFFAAFFGRLDPRAAARIFLTASFAHAAR
jgi:hypothetical protein